MVPASSHDIVMAVGLAALQKGRSVPTYDVLSKAIAEQHLHCMNLTTDLDVLADAPEDMIVPMLGSGPILRVRITAYPAICPIYELTLSACAGFDEIEIEQPL